MSAGRRHRRLGSMSSPFHDDTAQSFEENSQTQSPQQQREKQNQTSARHRDTTVPSEPSARHEHVQPHQRQEEMGYKDKATNPLPQEAVSHTPSTPSKDPVMARALESGSKARMNAFQEQGRSAIMLQRGNARKPQEDDELDVELLALERASILYYPTPRALDPHRAQTALEGNLERVTFDASAMSAVTAGTPNKPYPEDAQEAALQDVFAEDGPRAPRRASAVQRQTMWHKRLHKLMARKKTLPRRHTIGGLAEIHAFKSLDASCGRVRSPVRPHAPSPSRAARGTH